MATNTRRLTRVVNRFEELGLHPVLIQFYKDQEPFYYLDPSDEHDKRFPQPKTYVANLEKPDHYEGEVDAKGFCYGRGIHINELPNLTVI
jgi:hypothetical protein